MSKTKSSQPSWPFSVITSDEKILWCFNLYFSGRQRNLVKNMLPVLVLGAFMLAFLKQPLNEEPTNEGPCLKNRSRIRKSFLNGGAPIMEGFTCSLLQGNMVFAK